MLSERPDPREQVRDAIRDKVLARWVEAAHSGDAPDLPFEGDCDRIADWVMELFPDVELAHEHRSQSLILPVAPHIPGQVRATHSHFALRTTPEPIIDIKKTEGPK